MFRARDEQTTSSGRAADRETARSAGHSVPCGATR